MNLWRSKGIPKKNWRVIDCVDRGPNNLTICEMCNKQHIRYEHHVTHINYKQLVVGCVCAEKLSQGYKGAVAEKISVKKSSFHNKGWAQTSTGYHKIYNTMIIHLFDTQGVYSFRIDLRDGTWHLSNQPYCTEKDIKNAIWDMFRNEGWI